MAKNQSNEGVSKMAADYTADRQHKHLKMNKEEFNRCFSAIEDAFGIEWLNNGSGAIPKLWRSKNALAVNQLILLGDAISKIGDIDKKWVKKHIKLAKGNNAGQRQGSVFEIIAANLFNRAPNSIAPTKRDAPGYDLVLTAPDKGTAEISLKSFGFSSHEVGFRKEAKIAEDIFLDHLTKSKSQGVLFAIAESYPSTADWNELHKSIIQIPQDSVEKRGVWVIKYGSLPPDYEPYSKSYTSFQVFISSPFHPNESMNLSTKFDEAFANANSHANANNSALRLVLMRIPERISLATCDKWVKDYFSANPQVQIDGVFLYQIVTVEQEDGGSVVGHSFALTETNKFRQWSISGNPRRRIIANLTVGVPVSATSLRLTNGLHGFDFEEGYMYQKGNFYTIAHDKTGWIKEIASGIFQHSVMIIDKETELLIKGEFPESKEITMFD